MTTTLPSLAKLKPNTAYALLPLFDRSGWKRVRFGDVVENCAETCDPAEADGVSHDEGTGDGIGGRGDGAEHGVLSWVVIESAGELPNGAGGFQTVKGEVNPLATSEVEEVLRSEYPTSAMAVNAACDL